jgi:hypothetical protein
MTLTSILPTLRDSIPSPFDRAAWPAGAHPTVDDVVIDGVSLRRYEELCGTPCVCTGAAIVPLSGGVASATASTTVVLAAVTVVEGEHLHLDARFEGCAPIWREARLLGRVSHAYEAPFAVHAAVSGAVSGAVRLPGDLRAGDLLAVPCPGCFSVGDVRPIGS